MRKAFSYAQGSNMRSVGTERLKNLMPDAVSDEEKGSALGQLQSTEHKKVPSQQLGHYSPANTASLHCLSVLAK